MSTVQEMHGAAVETEDRPLIEKLAKLQDMYNQVSDALENDEAVMSFKQQILTVPQICQLRTLLPERLINPARIALENPGGCPPEKLASYLQTTARQGSREVQKFTQDWHSDEMRELWQTVNGVDLPQGGDAWTVDYLHLIKSLQDGEQRQNALDLKEKQYRAAVDENAAEVARNFKEKHPELKLHISDETKGLSIELEVAGMHLCVAHDTSSSVSSYHVSGKPDMPESSLLKDVLQTVGNRESKASLTELLVRRRLRSWSLD